MNPFTDSLRISSLTFLSLFCLASISSQVHALQISEILPENVGGLSDEDFTSPDWIEIFNETASSVNLDGWRLTDDPLLTSKWVFPARTIAAGERIIVFASGKDRRPVAEGTNMHTNFTLNQNGEYLALISPGGVIATDFNPFPNLRQNISFGNAPTSTSLPLIAEGAATKHFVPTDGSLGTTWTSQTFDDGAWASGAQGIGFDNDQLVSFDFKTVNNATSLPAPSGWISVSFSGLSDSASTGPSSISTTTPEGYTVQLNSVGCSLVSRNRNVATIENMLNDSGSLHNAAEDYVAGFTSNFTSGTPRGVNVTLSGDFTPNTTYPVRIWAYDGAASGTAARSATWTDSISGNSTTLTFNPGTTLNSDSAFNARSGIFNATTNAAGELIIQGRAAATGSTSSNNVFINAIQVGQPSYSSVISTNVASELQNNSSSLYTRHSFNVANTNEIDSLALKIRYDDGFVAYLNGQPLTSRNAPASPAWDSTATADQPKAAGLAFETITIPISPGTLLIGNNVLAIQTLKQSSSDTDALISVTLDATGTLPGSPSYYATPTPLTANSAPFSGLVRDVSFSSNRQFFTASVTTSLACSTLGAEIRYTTDGSKPTATSGTVYTTPLTFSSQTILRAAAFFPGWIPSNVDTQSYLRFADIAGQSATPAPLSSWPATWGIDSEVNARDGAGNGTVPANYAMDQRVITGAASNTGYTIDDALNDIPTISLAMNPTDFLGSSGIYQNPLFKGIESDCSVELMDPKGLEAGFHERCRVEVHGNSSRRPGRMQKHSLRLSFKGGDGDSSLKYRFFPGSRQDELNKIVLRATFTDGWGGVTWDSGRYRPDDSMMTRDVYMRKSWRDLGGIAPNSRYVHLVINGVYWGVYDAAEHIEENFVAEQLGGIPENWEVISDFDAINAGTSTVGWSEVFTLANTGLSGAAQYNQLKELIDIKNFADYYILHQYAETEDWPHHNCAVYKNINLPGFDTKYRWILWDQENAFKDATSSANAWHNVDRISFGATNTSTDRTPGRLWQQLRTNPEWRLLIADRLNALLNNNGQLSLANSQARWDAVCSTLDKAIVAESARWGDTAAETLYATKISRPGVPIKDPYLRDPDWTNQRSYVRDTWMPYLHNRTNTNATINRFANPANGFWPTTEPAIFVEPDRIVTSGFQLHTTAPLGTIYYTTNGTDPREEITGNAIGTEYSGQITLTQTGPVKLRVLNGGVWSALAEASFIVGTPASASSLVITEILMEPTTGSAGEFLEVMNISNTTIDLTNVKFTAGITYTFPTGTLLSPGQRTLINGTLSGTSGAPNQYTGRLDNAGERLTLLDASNAEIKNFIYGTSSPWPGGTGAGRSIVLINPSANPPHGDPLSWRPSVAVGGTPGTSDSLPFTGNPLDDLDNDSRPNVIEYVLGSSDSIGNLPHTPITSQVMAPATVGGPLVPHFAITVTRAVGTDAADMIFESSTDLTNWTPAVLVNRRANGEEVWRVATPNTERQFMRWGAAGPRP
jgi:hypothetical protein